MINIVRLAALLAVILAPLAAHAQQTTPARAAIVKDITSNAILLEKAPDEPLPPASMSKLMTLLMVFEAIDSGRIRMDDTFRTSAKAAAMGGSKMFIAEGEVVEVQDLLRGVIVQSGNDAAVALAEAVSGTESAFAELMNKRAAELGLNDSHFVNATGWPADGHMMSARDLARLAEIMILEHPELYKMFAEKEMTWAGIKQQNRNPLLGLGIGADGLKTGHTEEAGYGLVASAERDGRRVVLVVSGLDSTAQRSQETERLMNWAYRAFETRTLYSKDQVIAEADVWIGEKASVKLAPEKDVIVTAPYGQVDNAALAVVYDGPVQAPIEAGQRIGAVEVRLPDMPAARIPLIATEAVAEGGAVPRMQAAAQLLLTRALDAIGLEKRIAAILGESGEGEAAPADG